MRVWIAIFFVLFAFGEFYQWIKHFTLPLPIYILGGAFLAIASNYHYVSHSLFPQNNSHYQITIINPVSDDD